MNACSTIRSGPLLRSPLLALFPAVFLVACVGSTTPVDGTGGGAGRAAGTGGRAAIPGSGGSSSTGPGATGGSGVPTGSGSGGAAGAGGAPGSGSGGAVAPGSGGTTMPAASGGRAGTAGSPGTGGRMGTAGSPGTGGSIGTGGATATGGATGAGGAASTGPIGWASVNALNQNGTTGGGTLAATVVTSTAAFATAAGGTAARVIRVSGSMTGTVAVGSNKTIEGEAGALFTGSLQLENSVNVIVRNLKVVGLNCSDNANCEDGADAITVNTAHHIWVDHCDVSDGSDGNLDITDRSDYVTVSWSRFSYSGSGRIHRYSNIIGGSDTATADAGMLKVTMYNNWWADNVDQRQPRARFGQIHLFNNLYTSTASSYCVGLGVEANILTENNVFIGVRNPINATEFSNAASVVVSRGNLYQGTTGTTANQGTAAVFTPPYPYTLQAATAVEAAVRAGAGPR